MPTYPTPLALQAIERAVDLQSDLINRLYNVGEELRNAVMDGWGVHIGDLVYYYATNGTLETYKVDRVIPNGDPIQRPKVKCYKIGLDGRAGLVLTDLGQRWLTATEVE